MAEERIAEVRRETRETRIFLRLEIDGNGQAEIETGIPFFDHMLTLFAAHGLFSLNLKAEGDLEVDYHHTIEDVGLVLGEAVRRAIGERRGMVRYGFFILPMDETLVRVALDLGNRPAFVYRVDLKEAFVRDFNVGLVREFLQGFVNSCGANVHVALEYGDEPHHVAEAIFKGFGRALDAATRIDPRLGEGIHSTKGRY